MKTTLKKIFGTKIYLWFVILFAIIITIAYVYGYSTDKSNRTTASYSTVKYIRETNQEVFLIVGIQDVETQTTDTKIPWTKIGIPLTEKKAIIILNYEAKFGIKEAAKIKSTGPKSYDIQLPKYSVIGITLDSRNPYTLYDSRGELLSYSTEDIDTGKLATSQLTDKKQEKYLKQYKTLINQSAENYYKNIFKAIDPKIKLKFIFNK